MGVWESLLTQAKGIVYLDIPTGKGRTHTLKELMQIAPDKSLYSLYYSPLTGIGQLLYDLLSEVRDGFFTDYPEHGPVIRRYLHDRFFPALSSFKPYKPLALSQEQTLLFNALVDLVRSTGIKYWFIDDWLQDDYNYIFSVVLPELVAATNITVFVVGDAFPKEIAETVVDFDSLQPVLPPPSFADFCPSFGKDKETSSKLIEETKGNWHEVWFLCRAHATSLGDAVESAIKELPKDALDLLFGFAVMAERNSDFIKDILSEGKDPSMLELLEKLHLVFWEAPLYRFPSGRVRELVRGHIPQQRQEEILEYVTDTMAQAGYSDYWGRIATRYRMLGKRKKEAFALLMELRQEKGTSEALKIIERLDQLGVQRPGYKRLKSLCLYWMNDLKGATETIRTIEHPNIVDTANLIRFLSYSGEIDEAQRMIDKLYEHKKQMFDSLFFPRIAGDLVLPELLKGHYEQGLEHLETFLDIIVGRNAYLREHLGSFYNSFGVLLSYNGRLYAAYDAFERGLEILEPLDGSEVYLRLLANLSDISLEIEGPSSSFKYVNAAFRSTAPCTLALRAVALSNYCATYFQFMGMPTDALEELISLITSSDHKTKFDVGETSSVIYWLSGNIDKAEETLLLMDPESDDEKLRWNLFSSVICGHPLQMPLTAVTLSSSYPIYALLYLLKEEKEQLKNVEVFNSDRPIVLFLRAFRQGDTVENLMSFAVRAEHGWYLADAMFIYEFLASLIDGNEKVAFLEEAMRLAMLLGLDDKVRIIRQKIHSMNVPLSHSMNLQMLEKSLLSLPLEQVNVGGFLNYLGNILGHFYEEFFLSVSLGEQNFRIGRERINGFTINMYLPPFWGTFVVKNGSIADTLALKAILLSMEKVWSARYGTNDALTGLFNRNFGVEVLHRLWGGYERDGRSFTVVFFDVDDLKTINDTLGHPVGDEALRQVSKALTKYIRQSDFAVRWGGDEFLVILMQADTEGAAHVAARIESELINSPLTMSVSFGIVEANEVNSLDDLLREADKRMYAQKRTKKFRR
ncbi:GGDEF domain-containing protein [Coprothermobacter platensis]|uniref:GGDEF domain-containing protein n=1 Tax=Coprothermobacter platensis TaxID=108819 RepID=UPI0009FED3E5|nr:GGDEF domain-containing protein [Coprothermobacter platensis]